MQLMDLVPDLKPVILAARQVQDARNTLAQFLPNENVNGISYRLGRRRRADQTVPVRAFDAPSIPIRRPGIVEVRGDLPAITPRVDLSEVDLNNEMIMAQRLAGLQVDYQPFVEAAAASVATTIDNTLELMRGQVLSTAAIALQNEDGTISEVDFAVPAEQKINVVDKWNTDAGKGKAFDDLELAHQVFISTSGAPAGAILTTQRVRSVLIGQLGVMYPQQPVGLDTLNVYLANRGLPPIITNDRRMVADDGSKQRVFPEGTVTFLPSSDDPVGQTQLGVTQDAVQQVNRVQAGGTTALDASEAAGITIITLGQDDPVQRAVKGSAVGMPVLESADSIVILSGAVA